MEDSARRGGLKKLGATLEKLGGKAAGLVNNNKQQQQDTPRSAQAAAAAAAAAAGSGQTASHSPPDPVLEQLLRHVRSARVRRQFFAHPATEYTVGHDVRIFAGTYNVAGRRPPAGQRLHEWVHAWRDSWPPGGDTSGNGAGAPGPDIVVIGFQEVVALNAGNALLGPSSEGADGWDAVLAATLNGDEWATKNLGRTFGSSLASNPGGLTIDRLGSQAAYAYSVISGQTASAVVGAMDRLWAGDNSGGPGTGASGSSTPQPPAPPADLDAAAAEQQAARLLAAIAAADGEEVFVQVAAKQMVGLYLSVWARKRVARHVRGVQTTSAATGWGGFVGNKGAVAVRMRVYDTPLCAVCAHLASGDAEGDEVRRNADASDILRRCCFPTDAQMAALGLTSAGPPGHWGDLSSIPSHGNVIWLGDLNYRVSLPDDEARRLISAGRLERLLESDQLRREMAAGRAFQGWREGPITFAPTYKYHIGTDTYSGDPAPSPPPGLVRGGASGASLASLTAADSDPEGLPRTDTAGGTSGLYPGSGLSVSGLRGPLGRSSSRPKSRIGGGDGRGGAESPAPVVGSKRRTPAWTDRVLWLKGHALHQLAYGRAELAVSDHRPVAAAFLLQAHRYDRSLIESLLEEARRLVDASDMANRPRCSLEPKFLDVGTVAFASPTFATVRLTNDGPCDAFFYFVAPPRPRSRGGGGGGPVLWDDEQPPFPPWLRVTPEEGTVEAGATKELTLTVLFTGGPSATDLADAPPAAGGAPSHGQQQQQHSHSHQQQQQGEGSHVEQLHQQQSAEGALDAILILRVVDGSDFFIALNGSFVRSCLGRDLSDLASLGDAPAAPLAALSPAAAGLRAAALEAAAAAAAAEAAQAMQHQQQQQQRELEEGSSEAANAAAAAPLPPLQPAVAIEAPPLVPKEIKRLTSFLAAHLSTPGLFVHSYEIACGLFPPRGRQPKGAPQAERLAAATAGVRWALDTGEPLPQGTTPHQVAATLLSFFQQLPAPLVPPAVSAVLSRAVPQGAAAAQLLAAAMSPVEWATAQHVLDLLRAALEPAVAAENGLSLYAVSEAFAEYWFNGGGGGGAGGAVPSELAGNRIAFFMMLLDNPPTDSDTVGDGEQGGNGGGSSGGGNSAAARAGGWDAPESGPSLLD